MLQQYVRPISPDEQARIRRGIRFHQLSIRRAARRMPIGSLITCGIFWVLSLLLVRDQAWWVTTLVWAVIAGVIWLRNWLSIRKQHRGYIDHLEAVLRRDSVSVTRIAAAEVVQLDPANPDDGPCYAFQVEENQIVFVCDVPERAAAFPNTDFSIVDVQDAAGDSPWSFLHRHGQPLEPSRRLSVEVYKRIWPTDLQVIEGRLGDLETGSW